MVGAGALAPGQRWSASRKRDVVLRLLRGESLDAVSREVGVEVYRLEAWKARGRWPVELGKAQTRPATLAGRSGLGHSDHIGELIDGSTSYGGIFVTAGAGNLTDR